MVTTAAGTGSWPMFADGPAHNSVNRAETILGPSTVQGLRVTHTYGSWMPVLNDAPYQVIVGNLGYGVVGGRHGTANTYVAAFDLASGTRVWRHQISSHSNTWNFVPAVRGGTLFIGGDTTMYAFNAINGVTQWTTTVSNSSAADFNEVTVADGIVYADTYYGGTVYAFDAGTGRILWSRVPAGCCLTGSVSIAGGLAYVVTDHLIAYNARTGASAFHSSTTMFSNAVAVSAEVAYLAGSNSLEAYDAASGTLLWSSPLANGAYEAAVDGSTVVVGDGQYLTAFAAASGRQLWRVDSGSPTTDYSLPAIANGVIYAASLGQGLQAVDEVTGSVLYSKPGACLNPLVASGSVYSACLGAGGFAVTAFQL